MSVRSTSNQAAGAAAARLADAVAVAQARLSEEATTFGRLDPVGPVRLSQTLAAYVAGRSREVNEIADTALEGELVIVSAADPSLTSALADAAAFTLADRNKWAVVRADARLAADENALAEQLMSAAIGAIARVEFPRQMLGADAAQEGDDGTPTVLGRALLEATRALGGSRLTVHGDTTEGALQTLGVAVQAVVSAREALAGRLVLVLHGVDELARGGRSRFADGAGALWQLRGLWQQAHGAALLSGGSAAAAMANDERQAFYGYGQLHEAKDLPEWEVRRVLGQVLREHSIVTTDGVAEAARLVGQALWLAPGLCARLSGEAQGPSAVRAAFDRLVEEREVEHHQLLRALTRVHRLALPVLTALANGTGPYASTRGERLRPADVSRALLALEDNGAVQRLGHGAWRLADPTLAARLRGTGAR